MAFKNKLNKRFSLLLYLKNFFFRKPHTRLLFFLLLGLLPPLLSFATELPALESSTAVLSTTELPTKEPSIVEKPASQLPIKAFTVKYSAVLDGSRINGSAVRQLIHKDNGESVFSFNADVNIATLSEESILGWNQCTPISKTYNRSSKVLFSKRQQSIQFDHQKLKAQYNYKKKSGNADIPENTLDRIALQLALRCDLKQGKNEGSYTVFDRNKIKHYRFQVIGEEEIETPVGKLLTTKVQLLRKNKNRQTWLWFSKQHDYLLVKLTQTESSSNDFSITISEIELI